MAIIQSGRPNRLSEDGIVRVADLLLPKVLEWMTNSNDEGVVLPTKQIQLDLIDALSSDHHDGYQLASLLDRRCNWMCDAELVAVLDDALTHIDWVKQEELRQWVVTNNVTPKLSINDRCVYRGAPARVVSIDKSLARYHLAAAAMGHDVDKNNRVCFVPFEMIDK